MRESSKFSPLCTRIMQAAALKDCPDHASRDCTSCKELKRPVERSTNKSFELRPGTSFKISILAVLTSKPWLANKARKKVCSNSSRMRGLISPRNGTKARTMCGARNAACRGAEANSANRYACRASCPNKASCGRRATSRTIVLTTDIGIITMRGFDPGNALAKCFENARDLLSA